MFLGREYLVCAAVLPSHQLPWKSLQCFAAYGLTSASRGYLLKRKNTLQYLNICYTSLAAVQLATIFIRPDIIIKYFQFHAIVFLNPIFILSTTFHFEINFTTSVLANSVKDIVNEISFLTSESAVII